MVEMDCEGVLDIWAATVTMIGSWKDAAVEMEAEADERPIVYARW